MSSNYTESERNLYRILAVLILLLCCACGAFVGAGAVLLIK